MLPDDPYFDAKDPGSDFPPGLANTLQRSVDAGKANGSTGTFPAPDGTTLPWGGGRILFAKSASPVGATPWDIDDSIDWNNRFVLVFGCAYSVAHVACLPGEGSEPSGGPQPDFSFGRVAMAAEPDLRPCFGYLKYAYPGPGPDVLLYDNTPGGTVNLVVTSTGGLRMTNTLGTDIYPMLWIFATDQFPART